MTACAAKTADGHPCAQARVNLYDVAWKEKPREWKRKTGVGNGRRKLCAAHARSLRRKGAVLTKIAENTIKAKKAKAKNRRKYRSKPALTNKQRMERRKLIAARARALGS